MIYISWMLGIISLRCRISRPARAMALGVCRMGLVLQLITTLSNKWLACLIPPGTPGHVFLSISVFGAGRSK